MGKGFVLFACSLMKTEVLTHFLQYLYVKNHELLCLTPHELLRDLSTKSMADATADEIMLI